MRRDNTPWRPVTAAAIGWTDEGVPQSLHFGDVYYSRDDGLAESEYVFLRGNDLPRRWLNWPAPGFCIAETGFGTGLNFLLTWQAWRDAPEPRPSLQRYKYSMPGEESIRTTELLRKRILPEQTPLPINLPEQPTETLSSLRTD